VERLNVAVWGLGHHAVSKILPAIGLSPGITLAGVLSRRRDVVAQACAHFACRTWDGPDALLRDGTIDVVVLATPIGLHAQHEAAVLAAGKHLWCEKPLAANHEQATALIAASRQQGRVLAEGFMYLYHPQFAMLKVLLSEGRVGRVLSVTCRFGIPDLEQPGFRTDPGLGGGAFLDVGSYPISAVLALFPDQDPCLVSAEVGRPRDGQVDTDGHAVLRLDDGALAILEWRIGAAYRNEIDVWGSEGSVATERIFSKPPEHIPRFRLRDRSGVETWIYARPANHFVEMRTEFRSLVDDAGAAEAERERIGRRARLAAWICGELIGLKECLNGTVAAGGPG
jgi:dTDP-3,4-didehydro-2,6-dideoxy-alpha-D-glucose 3-reductase